MKLVALKNFKAGKGLSFNKGDSLPSDFPKEDLQFLLNEGLIGEKKDEPKVPSDNVKPEKAKEEKPKDEKSKEEKPKKEDPKKD